MPPERRNNKVREKNKEFFRETENIDIRKKMPLKVKECINAEGQSDNDSDSNDQFDRLLSSPLKQNVNLKPLSFWSKKLKDLELDEVSMKKKKNLYEFTTSEDSFSPKKRKKKRAVKKYQASKKKQVEFQINSKKNINAYLKSKIKALKKDSAEKENEEAIDKQNKCVFTKIKPSLILTSTPASKKAMLVDASNFLFLSPIEKRKVEDVFENEINKKHALLDSNVSTPKISNPKKQKRENDLNESKCLRVLRSRKILITK